MNYIQSTIFLLYLFCMLIFNENDFGNVTVPKLSCPCHCLWYMLYFCIVCISFCIFCLCMYISPCVLDLSFCFSYLLFLCVFSVFGQVYYVWATNRSPILMQKNLNIHSIFSAIFECLIEIIIYS